MTKLKSLDILDQQECGKLVPLDLRQRKSLQGENYEYGRAEEFE